MNKKQIKQIFHEFRLVGTFQGNSHTGIVQKFG